MKLNIAVAMTALASALTASALPASQDTINTGPAPAVVADYDAIVVGGGPSGLAAASALARVRRRVLMIDSGEYRNQYTRRVHDVLGFDGKFVFMYQADSGGVGRMKRSLFFVPLLIACYRRYTVSEVIDAAILRGMGRLGCDSFFFQREICSPWNNNLRLVPTSAGEPVNKSWNILLSS